MDQKDFSCSKIILSSPRISHAEFFCSKVGGLTAIFYLVSLCLLILTGSKIGLIVEDQARVSRVQAELLNATIEFESFPE